MFGDIRSATTRRNKVELKSPSANATYTDLVPAGYVLDKIIVSEEDGNAVTGFKVGTTAGGAEIVPSYDLVANEHIVFTPIIDFFSWSAGQDLSFYATNFNGSTLRVSVLMRKAS